MIALKPTSPAQPARLVEPAGPGYVLLAAEVDLHQPLLWTSPTKRRLIEDVAGWCRRVAREPGVFEAVAFKAIVMPRLKAERARFDLAVLIQTDSVARGEALRRDVQFQLLEAHVRDNAERVWALSAANAKRVGTVDHLRDGVFLFSYLHADTLAQNLAVWDSLRKQTGMQNATALAPMPPDLAPYTLINHSRWERLRDVLPALIFKRSLFDADDTAPMPVLYKLAS